MTENHLDPARLKELLRALLFVSGESLSTGGLRSAVGSDQVDGKQVRAALEELADDLDKADSGVRLVRIGGSWQFRTDPQWAQWLRRFTAKRPVRLSRSAVECLAIMAYRQPATRIDVETIRGVDSGGPIRTLLDRGLLKILGRRDEPGRPMVYGTAPYFLQVFGLNSLSDLPSLNEFSELEPEDLPARASQALQSAFEDLLRRKEEERAAAGAASEEEE